MQTACAFLSNLFKPHSFCPPFWKGHVQALRDTWPPTSTMGFCFTAASLLVTLFVYKISKSNLSISLTLVMLCFINSSHLLQIWFFYFTLLDAVWKESSAYHSDSVDVVWGNPSVCPCAKILWCVWCVKESSKLYNICQRSMYIWKYSFLGSGIVSICKLYVFTLCPYPSFPHIVGITLLPLFQPSSWWNPFHLGSCVHQNQNHQTHTIHTSHNFL